MMDSNRHTLIKVLKAITHEIILDCGKRRAFLMKEIKGVSLGFL